MEVTDNPENHNFKRLGAKETQVTGDEKSGKGRDTTSQGHREHSVDPWIEVPSTEPGVERALTQTDCCCLRVVILSINSARAHALAELRVDLVTVVCIFLLSAAPSQPPRIISSVRSGSRYVITWDHVIALANESTVTGYKVGERSLD